MDTITESPNHQETLDRVKHHPSSKRLFLNVLQVQDTAQNHPNTYLNLARLFAPTKKVLLLPGTLSKLDRNLYNVVISHSTHTPSMITLPAPAIPASPLTPILMPKDYPIWCTERHFLATTRANDWDECIWQVWLQELGALDHIKSEVSSPRDADVQTYSEYAVSYLLLRLLTIFRAGIDVFEQVTFRQRLVGRQRAESCEQAKREASQATYVSGQKRHVVKRRQEFYKQFCR